MGKAFSRFQTKTAQTDHIPFGAFGVTHAYLAYIREYPRGATLFACLDLFV